MIAYHTIDDSEHIWPKRTLLVISVTHHWTNSPGSSSPTRPQPDNGLSHHGGGIAGARQSGTLVTQIPVRVSLHDALNKEITIRRFLLAVTGPSTTQSGPGDTG
jgi:hypothetical protein